MAWSRTRFTWHVWGRFTDAATPVFCLRFHCLCQHEGMAASRIKCDRFMSFLGLFWIEENAAHLDWSILYYTSINNCRTKWISSLGQWQDPIHVYYRCFFKRPCSHGGISHGFHINICMDSAWNPHRSSVAQKKHLTACQNIYAKHIPNVLYFVHVSHPFDIRLTYKYFFL